MCPFAHSYVCVCVCVFALCACLCVPWPGLSPACDGLVVFEGVPLGGGLSVTPWIIIGVLSLPSVEANSGPLADRQVELALLGRVIAMPSRTLGGHHFLRTAASMEGFQSCAKASGPGLLHRFLRDGRRRLPLFLLQRAVIVEGGGLFTGRFRAKNMKFLGPSSGPGTPPVASGSFCCAFWWYFQPRSSILDPFRNTFSCPGFCGVRNPDSEAVKSPL
jgi:hypothetical protein